MKFTSQQKKTLALGLLVLSVIILTGCTAPTDPQTHKVILLDTTKSFGEVFKNENWFTAIFVWPMCWIINNLTPIIGVGGAIAVLTIVINGSLAALTLKSQISTQKMQVIQPELDRIKRKYEGRNDEASKMRMMQEQQQLMRESGISMGSMMLVQFLQLPIILAMFQAVQRSESIANGTFLGMDLQITPLTAITKLFTGQFGFISYVILFLLMGITQFLLLKVPQLLQQARYNRIAKKQHRKPQQVSTSNASMQYSMIGMVIVFGLMWSSGMSLYWFIRNIVDIIKTLIIQKIIDKKEGV